MCSFGEFIGKVVKVVAIGGLCSLYSHAENYSGVVVSGDNGEPLEFVNVIALSRDSAFVNGAVSDAGGVFEIQGNNIYNLKLSLIGYETRLLNVANESCDTIVLAPVMNSLGEVTVGYNRFSRFVGADMVTDVAGTPLANLSSVSQVLSYLPMLYMGDEGVKVFGKGTPVFYINNRRVIDMQEVTTLLPSEIKSVRVIANPDRRYDSGAGSVIVINTVRPVGEGLSGWVLEDISGWRYWCNRTGINVNYRHKGWDAFMRVYQTYSDNSRVMEYENEIYTTHDRTEVFRLDSRSKHNGLSLKAGVNCIINELHSVGASYTVSTQKTKSVSNTHSEFHAIDQSEVTDEVDDAVHKTPSSHLVNVYYDGKVGKFRIAANFDYYGLSSNKISHYFEQGVSPLVSEFESSGWTKTTFFAENITVSYDTDRTKLSIGQEWTSSVYNSSYFAETLLSGIAASRNTEKAFSVFATLQQHVGQLDIRAGLRMEYRKMIYQGLTYDNRENHFNLFPSIGLGGTTLGVTWNIGYDYRLTRPPYSMMTNEISYMNRYTYQSGNPELHPLTEHQLYLTAQWRYLWLQAGFSQKDGEFCIVSSPMVFGEDVILQKWVNLPRYNSVYIVAGGNYKYKLWSASLSVGMMRQCNSMYTIYQGDVALKSPIAMIQFHNICQLPHGWQVMCNYDYTSGGDNQLSEYKSTHNLSFGVVKAFFNNSLNLTFMVDDILNKSIMRYKQYDECLVKAGWSDFSKRKVSVSVRYNFNTARDRYRGKGSGASERQRL